MYKPLKSGTFILALISLGACSETVGTTSKVVAAQTQFVPTQNLIKAASKRQKASGMSSSISDGDISWSKAVGSNTIYGSAFVNDEVQGVKVSQTCEGEAVKLIPKTAYSDERMSFYFDNLRRGYLDSGGYVKKKRGEWPAYSKQSAAGKKGILAGGDNPIYLDSIRESYCDQRGDFLFENIPDGEYFITSTITWGADTWENDWRPGKSWIQGGRVMQHVKVAGGIRQRAILSNK